MPELVPEPNPMGDVYSSSVLLAALVERLKQWGMQIRPDGGDVAELRMRIKDSIEACQALLKEIGAE